MKELFTKWLIAMLAPFGTWESPITTDTIVKDAIRFAEVRADEEALYWIEARPKQKGKSILVRYDGNEVEPLGDSSVRSRVHEYGGGAFCLADGRVVYSNDEDRQLYRLEADGTSTRLTNAPTVRFADGCRDIWVAERYEDTIDNFLVRVGKGELEILASGHDFYSSPRISPDGKQLAYITWDFPNMQWDSSTLWLADLDAEGKLVNERAIAGGPDASVCQVKWSPEGVLHYACDETGFWNLYRHVNGVSENLCKMEAEFGEPAWVFGSPTYDFLPDGRVICRYVKKAIARIGIVDPKEKTLQDLKQPFTFVSNVTVFGDKVYFIGASPTQYSALICYDPTTNTSTILKKSLSTDIPPEWISEGEILEYPAQDGKKGYAFYYPPKNPNFQGPEGEKPPLIVKAHGGPTGNSFNYLMLDVQFWTSRGFAFVDVNYGGSTGYGRQYFKRLEKNWGVVDVEDCVSAAQTLVGRGDVDPSRIVIRGGSAGGYTTLAALCFTDVFAGGTSYFGISDLGALYGDTHKFESYYNDLLIGPYEESREKIRERSPIYHVDSIKAPVLLLQGAEDKIVLPNQSEMIYEKLKEKEIPTGMILFEGEGHGFRQAENIKRAFDAELYFYGKILNIPLADSFPRAPVDIYPSGTQD